MELFQRAEASTFFGREIGVMYMHAHLRYAEALARVGDAPGLLRALALAHPLGITDRVPMARPRQSTCYFSSSDAAFDDRYQADAEYGRIADGSIAAGGWLAGLLVRPRACSSSWSCRTCWASGCGARGSRSTRCSIPISTACGYGCRSVVRRWTSASPSALAATAASVVRATGVALDTQDAAQPRIGRAGCRCCIADLTSAGGVVEVEVP